MTSYSIKGPWAGELAIILRPRGGDWLPDEIEALKDEGFEVIVSLLTEPEIEELDLQPEAELARKNGLEFRNYPIPDLGVPDSHHSFRKFLERLLEELRAGKKIAVHCRGGIGRSGLIASGILVISGIEPKRAIQQVTDARGVCSPETEEQKKWVTSLTTEPERFVA